MHAVIFRATARVLDEDYATTAALLREMALRHFGCLEFHAVTAGDQEIALSYWTDLAAITAWKVQVEHLAAQRLGRERWYSNYHVQIARIERDYSSPKDAS